MGLGVVKLKKETARVYLYTSKTNATWLEKQAKKAGVSKSKLLDKLISEGRKAKFTLAPTKVKKSASNKK